MYFENIFVKYNIPSYKKEEMPLKKSVSKEEEKVIPV